MTEPLEDLPLAESESERLRATTEWKPYFLADDEPSEPCQLSRPKERKPNVLPSNEERERPVLPSSKQCETDVDKEVADVV